MRKVKTPLASFTYALKSSEARRQYPRRLQLLFDFLGLPGALNEQALTYFDNVKKSQTLEQANLMKFFEYHKARIQRKEITTGTLLNYYRAIKLFCEMNDISFNWKKLTGGN